MKICLVMIVKNESHVLRRALQSVSGITEVEYACIVDTGSTQIQFEEQADIIAEVFNSDGVHWEYQPRPWVDFGANRTEALRLAEETFPDADYLFMLDADDYVTRWDIPDNFGDDAGQVMIQSGTQYPRLQLFAAHTGWEYRGILHEFPELVGERAATVTALPITVQSTREGARSRNPWKYADDAIKLVAALENPETAPDLIPRYQFYVAQSCRDAGDLVLAESYYKLRAANERGYQEERYVSLCERAKILESTRGACLVIEALAHEAQQICPHRREAVIMVARALRVAGQYKRALDMLNTYPQSPNTGVPVGLFIKPSCYQWRWYDEHALSSHFLGNYKQAMSSGLRAVTLYPHENEDIRRLVSNLGFTYDKL